MSWGKIKIKIWEWGKMTLTVSHWFRIGFCSPYNTCQLLKNESVPWGMCDVQGTRKHRLGIIPQSERNMPNRISGLDNVLPPHTNCYMDPLALLLMNTAAAVSEAIVGGPWGVPMYKGAKNKYGASNSHCTPPSASEHSFLLLRQQPTVETREGWLFI
jgi:hypothetical protein